MLRVLVIHGPNLNLLGKREPDVYGKATLDQIDSGLQELAATHGVELETFQSNIEGEIVTRLQEAGGNADGVIINAAGYTHTSVAIRDAIAAIEPPTIEVHLTNTKAREDFRKESLLAAVVQGRVEGFGSDSYRLGLIGLLRILGD